MSLLDLSTRSQAFGASESTLWSFGNGLDGSSPFASLIVDTGGKLYRTIFGGGANNNGTVFELTPPAIAGVDRGNSVGLWQSKADRSMAIDR